MKKIRPLFWVILISSATAAWPIFAQTPPAAPPGGAETLPDGEKVIEKSRALLFAIEDQKNKVTLKLTDKNGAQKQIVAWRYWKNYNNEDGFSGKTVIFTESPPDVKGQTILIWDYSKEGKTQDLWIYLPTLRQTRRVLPQNQDEAFMGSDLTFADMGQRRLDEDTHRAVKKDVYKGVPSLVVESIPKEKESSIYSKKVTWVSEKDDTIQKIDYYDRNGKLLKRQTIDWQTVQEKEKTIYVWKKTEVVNVQTGHRTAFEVGDLKVNIGLSNDDFTERVLTTGGPKK